MSQTKIIGLDAQRLESWCGADRLSESWRKDWLPRG